MGIDSAGRELRVYRARGFYRSLFAAPHVNLAVATLVCLGGVALAIATVVGVLSTEMAFDSLLFFVVLLPVVALFAVNVRRLWLMVREVEQHPDGHLEVATSFGKRAALHEGDVVRIGPQLPFPWGRRVRTRDAGTFYFGGYERQGELMSALHRLRA